MVWTERQPRARKESAHGQVGTGQKTLGEEIFLVRVGVHLLLGSRSGGLDEMPRHFFSSGLAVRTRHGPYN